jgi:hypothetical protein
MALKDLSTFLSRFFVVGFYLPTLFSLALVSILLRKDWVPNAFELVDSRGKLVDNLGVTIVKIAVLSLPVALLLSGVWRRIFQLFRGAPFFGLDTRLAARPWGRRLQPLLVRRQWRAWDELFAATFDRDDYARTAAARTLDLRYPTQRDRVQPGRFGNVVRAYEEYSQSRWGLDFQAAWPRVEPLLAEYERALHDDARTSLAFALNLTLGLFAAGVARLAGDVAGGFLHSTTVLDVLPFVAGYAVYRLLALDALMDVGGRIRSSIDLHRLELFDKLGARKVPPYSDLEAGLATAIGRHLLYGTRNEDIGGDRT